MALSRRLNAGGWTIRGTCRDPARLRALKILGIDAALFNGSKPMEPTNAVRDATHVLLSIPPGSDGDPAFFHHAEQIAKTRTVKWVGYLSTTGVYGNRDGDWVDETSDLRPSNLRSKRRVDTERMWLRWGDYNGIPTQIFRLAGIYGPGRSVADQIKRGTAMRISKPGQAFSRIHVEDIATVLAASIANPRPGGIYNVCDDEPAPSSEVTSYVCGLMNIAPPPLIPFEKAALSPISKSFWEDNRRVRNDKIKAELGVKLAFPDYRTGMRAVLGN